MDPVARAELRTLPGHLADAVAGWLAAAAAEPDPDRAFEYAVQARKLAARVGVVRETAGVAGPSPWPSCVPRGGSPGGSATCR